GISGPDSHDNTVAGNKVGTDVTGTRALGNTDRGFNINGFDNTIGTNADGRSDALERNLISGNGTFGVVIAGASPTGNVVAGNMVGTEVTGTRALGNAAGVVVSVGAQNNTIGGTRAAARNVISANSVAVANGGGVLLSDPGTSGNVVRGN